MKKLKSSLQHLIFLLISVILILQNINAETSSGSLKVIIKLPSSLTDTTTSIYSHFPSSILLPSQSHKSPNIEVVDFNLNDNLIIRIKNLEEKNRIFTLRLTFINRTNFRENNELNYENINLNSLKQIKITVKDNALRSMNKGLVIAEIIEDGITIFSIGANKNHDLNDNNIERVNLANR
ncbi:TPA: hypothetical protein DCW38_01270 [candidate division WOR-3 bacterium]|uniref:Uncharacterized protein n=1 Tax=candidate division WOR-3 bacterium TaxID=2052148 RepID=A0A350H8D1_UNCW3|nr:hypothetical protein [candidate division WOR-3 bacterium]